MGPVVEAQAGTDDVGVGTEARVPVAVAENDIGFGSGQTAQEWCRAQQRIEIVGGGSDADVFGKRTVGTDAVRGAPRSQVFEAPGAFPPVEEVPIGERHALEPALRVAAADPGEPAGFLERERTKQRLVGEAPDRGRDAEGNGQNRHDAGGESRVAENQAETVGEVLAKLFEPDAPSHIAQPRLYSLRVSEIQARLPPGVGGRQASPLQAVGLRLQVKRQFVRQLSLVAVSPHQGAEPETCACPHACILPGRDLTERPATPTTEYAQPAPSPSGCH